MAAVALFKCSKDGGGQMCAQPLATSQRLELLKLIIPFQMSPIKNKQCHAEEGKTF